MSVDLGPWDPLSLDEAVDLFADAGFRWWVTGGHALELYAGSSWRTHADTDLSFLRSDAALVYQLLAGWDMHVAAAGRLRPWHGGSLDAAAHHNNVWCRRSAGEPWALDLTISDGDDDHWIYRRDQTLTVPWPSAVLRSPGGVPYLAPELQLLFKSAAHRPKDNVDFAHLLPLLTPDQQTTLANHLPRDHPWRNRT